jgi:hypothetical protein
MQMSQKGSPKLLHNLIVVMSSEAGNYNLVRTFIPEQHLIIFLFIRKS